MKVAVLFIACFPTLLLASSEHDKSLINQRINRLDKHILFLEQVHSRNKELIKTITAKQSSFQFNSTNYQHDLMKLCLKQIKTKYSFETVFKTWNLFLSTFRDVDTELFMQELSLLIFCVYKNLIVSLVKPDQKVSSLEILQLSSQIISLPIDKVLDALDRCYQQFMEIMQDNGMATATSPKEWLKRYWWVIPVSVASLIVSAARYFIMRPFWRTSQYSLKDNCDLLIHDNDLLLTEHLTCDATITRT